ncbi:GYDIA family GHMP kinase [Flavobacterium sp. GT3R68]|uniref:GYDIA family GHMP kinase n=1 Tax=Flavobacterium sp. GT3R68 TaxID=2594437 RepID=UPI000F87EFF2|nr:GYDIA family GHMP kinase [Flavobacterium sp. GT3R68]RTY92434.1 GHMP kinase [Flavobacterium sp. GSN2]TRW94058.1 GHMP kinase [Flavobacterium sp. GT3R68]
MKKTYYSNGKLLITGEYVVLDGAKALAIPTKFGQNLTVEPGKDNAINWTSYDKDGSVWFQEVLEFDAIENKPRQESQTIKETLTEILHEAFLLNPDFITKSKGHTVTTRLTFPKSWGLGTSSTLINNIAQWLQIDAFTLLRNSFGGSGYDIACAQNNTPIIYRLDDGKPIVEPVEFHPDFTENLYFVYLNKKQSSKKAIVSYHKKHSKLSKTIPAINKITETVVNTDLKTFANQLEDHEIILSHILEMQTVKEALFHDFTGVIKSLGAWGGDFVLAVSKQDPSDYFKSKGYTTVIPYHDMILA